MTTIWYDSRTYTSHLVFSSENTKTILYRRHFISILALSKRPSLKGAAMNEVDCPVYIGIFDEHGQLVPFSPVLNEQPKRSIPSDVGFKKVKISCYDFTESADAIPSIILSHSLIYQGYQSAYKILNICVLTALTAMRCFNRASVIDLKDCAPFIANPHTFLH